MTDLAVLLHRCGYDAIDVDRRARGRPDRFLVHAPGAFEVVPQGGGHPSGHRCPGEPIALGLLVETALVLAETEYDVVPPRDPDPSRIPTLPPGGLMLSRVRVSAGRRH